MSYHHENMNMFKPVKAKTVEEYIASLPPEKQRVVEYLDKFIKESAPTLKPHFSNNMLGYGSFKYRNYKKEIIDWPTIALASQKNYVSIYICAVNQEEYLAEKYKKELGKVSVGRSCIRISKIDNLNLDILKKVIKLAEKNPGLVL